MLFTSLVTAALLSLAQAVDVHVVAVGLNPVNNATGTKFFPEKINATVGSMVQFQFWAGNHSVTQSNFDNPCVPISTSNTSAVGIDSSFQPVAASASNNQFPTYTIMINDTKPLWFYCKQGMHCEAGMSLVINENTAANKTRSLEQYQTLSKSATGSSSGSGSGSGSGSSGSGNPPPNSASTLSLSSSILVVVGAAFMLL